MNIKFNAIVPTLKTFFAHRPHTEDAPDAELLLLGTRRYGSVVKWSEQHNPPPESDAFARADFGQD